MPACGAQSNVANSDVILRENQIKIKIFYMCVFTGHMECYLMYYIISFATPTSSRLCALLRSKDRGHTLTMTFKAPSPPKILQARQLT